MNSLVIYDSLSGNTEQLARAIGATLKSFGTVEVVLVGNSEPIDLTGVDLLVVGGPTHGHGISRPLSTWITRLSGASLTGIVAATFDTRFNWPILLSGSAARSLARALERKGARLLAPPQSYFVKSTTGPLVDGELDRAVAWAKTLAAALPASAVAMR